VAADDFVQSSRFDSGSKVAKPDPTGNRFACSAEERKLEVMDDPRAVHSNVCHNPAFDQTNDVSQQSQLDKMSAYHLV